MDMQRDIDRLAEKNESTASEDLFDDSEWIDSLLHSIEITHPVAVTSAETGITLHMINSIQSNVEYMRQRMDGLDSRST